MPTRRILSAVAAAVAVGLTLRAAGVSAQTALDERQQHVATITTGEIERLTGAPARNCGIFPLPAVDAPSPVGRDELRNALRCVQSAQRRGEAAWAIWQVSGVDAIVFDGLAASAASAVHLVHGEGSAAEIALRPCLEPRVGEGAVVTCANLDWSPSARDVDRALDGLARDVRRTAGLTLKDLVAGPDVAADAPLPTDPAARIDRAVDDAQRAVHAAGEPQWPRCPHHFDHPLTHLAGWWYCERDRAFIARLGRVASAVPVVKKKR